MSTIATTTPRRGAHGGDALEFEAPPRATIGCIQLPTDVTLDEDGPQLVSRLPGVRLRLNKLELDGDGLDVANYSSGAGRLTRAAATLRPRDSLDALGLACTSLSFTLGRERVHDELRAAHPSAAITDMASAVVAALHRVSASRIALMTPYVDELHRMNVDLLERSGFEVVVGENLGLISDADISAIRPQSLAERILRLDRPDADAVFVGCSAFRVCSPGFIPELEARLGKPVVTSQQAFLWHMLELAGVTDRLVGYGRLFGDSPSARPREERTASTMSSTPSTRTTSGAQPPASAHRDSSPDLYPSRVPAPSVVERCDPVTDPRRGSAGPLSAEELDRLDDQGFLVLRNVFEEREVDLLRSTVEALRDTYEARSHEELDGGTDMRVITERGGGLGDSQVQRPVLKSIWQVHLPAKDADHMGGAGPITRRALCDARLVDVARQILGEDVYVHQSRINFQPGWNSSCRGGSGFLWHQDFEQWHSEDGMPRMRAVSLAVLLERAVPANGALMVMPGSHRSMIQAYGGPGDGSELPEYRRGALSSGPVLPDGPLKEFADRRGIVHCSGEPGDVVLFDCNIVHGSHTNISPWGRCMLFAVYNAISNTCRAVPFAGGKPRPEHIGSHDLRWAGVPLPALSSEWPVPPRR